MKIRAAVIPVNGLVSIGGPAETDEPDDEMYAPAPAPRRATAGGWFSRLNRRRRGHQLSHDDGMVTRHADWDAWTAVDNDTWGERDPRALSTSTTGAK